MPKENRKWDIIQSEFDASKNSKKNPKVADIEEIAWPVMMQLISDYHMGKSTVLDFGCGAGAFCRHMRTGGLQVEGIDFSSKMIKAASRYSSHKIRFHTGDKKALLKLKDKFDVITSVMVFQFMKDFESYLSVFHEILNFRGIVVFAVYNPDFVKTCYENKVLFASFKKTGSIVSAAMKLGKGTKVDTYIRARDQYKKLFEKHGFEYLSSRYPPFTQEFIDKYKWKLPSDNAEFLIMSVRKR